MRKRAAENHYVFEVASLREPLLLPAIGLAGGILLDEWLHFTPGLAFAASGCFAFLFVTALAFRRVRVAWITGVLALAATGAGRHAQQEATVAPFIDAQSSEIVVLEGCVVDPPAVHSPGDRSRFLLELEPGAIAQVSIYIREGDEPPVIRYGERIEFEGRVRKVRNFGNPGAFDFAHYLGRRNIYWNVSARVDTKIAHKGSCGNPVSALVFRIRTAMEERIERLYPNQPYVSAMMTAILIGQSDGLERVWTDEFRRTGTYHALVVSGMHFTSLAFLMMLGFRLISAGPKLQLFVGLLTGWLYTAVCGWTAPVVRAAGALTLFLIGRWMFRRLRLLNALAAVAIAYLLLDPGQLFEASFQLSFAAVAALGALAQPWMESTSATYADALGLIDKKGRDFRVSPTGAEFRVEVRLLAETISLWTRIPYEWALRGLTQLWRGAFLVWELLSVSFVMQVALMIPMAVYFHRVTWTGLTANLIVVPLMTIVVPVGFAAIATGWSVPAVVAQWCLETSSKIALWHVQVADAHFERRLPDAPWWALALVAGMLVLSALLFRMLPHWRWFGFASGLAASLALVFATFPPLFEPGILELTMIDIGQGDSLLVAFPEGQRMIVDGGGLVTFGNRGVNTRKPRLDTGEDVVSPYLWRRRLDRVDIIASTHAHDDHIGGLPALLENFRPRELWTGALPPQPAESWKRVEETARRLGIRIVQQKSTGKEMEFGGAHIEVLSPDPEYQPAATARNNDSLVMRIRFGERSILLTGDAEKPVEQQLVYAGKLQQVDVLKAAHHGSRTSSTPEFLEIIRPRIAIVSAGFENQFRHPHPAVLKVFAEHGIEVLRTDQHGLIQIRTDGRNIEVHTPATTPDN